MKTLQDEVLGTLTYDQQLGWYETTLGNFKLYLPCESEREADESLNHARSFHQSRTRLIREAAAFGCESLVDLKNETWLDEGEEALSKETFVSRLSIEAVVVYPDGSVEFTFGDGDLFWGHVIQVSYEDNVFVEAGIAG